ncbi:glycosyltransferase family 4 protein [Cohnella algarum]|uniref:glycosyltransferase family 4 protein n=1 Tax=Cohnella algarum TaxID=2044859 RepID=UPI001F07D37F|nr:glycosyltransferase family 4 protein [Cohnella algarum]
MAFFHDFPVFKDEKNHYFSIGFSYSLWERYLKLFSSLIVGCRVRNLDDYKNETFKNNLQRSDGQNVSIRPISEYTSHKDYLVNRMKIIQQINTIIKEVDCVVVRLPSVIGSLAYKQAIKQKKVIICELVACPWDSLWNFGKIKTKIAAPIMYLKTKKIIKDAQNVLYVTNEFLQKRYKNTNNNIGCSDVEIYDFPDTILLERINKKRFNEVIKIGLIGSSGNRFKGHETAIKAISLLKDKYSIHLHLLGHGNIGTIKNLIEKEGLEENIKLDGIRKSGEDVWGWLDQIDIYVQPSLQEGMNRATIEAMSRACPVITSNVGGFPEVVRGDFIIKKKDYKELARKIEDLLTNKSLYAEICKYNFYKSKSFTKSNLDSTRESFFLSCIANKEKGIKI